MIHTGLDVVTAIADHRPAPELGLSTETKRRWRPLEAGEPEAGSPSLPGDPPGLHEAGGVTPPLADG